MRTDAVEPRAPLVDGEIVLDFATRTARRDRTEIHLTAKEWALLAHLAATPGRTVSRQELLDAVWGYAPQVVTRTVDNTVRRLRSKIERNPSEPRLLVTIYGDGYRLERGSPPVAPSAALIGRELVVERLRRDLADGGWTTILGPPGIGKTSVARAVLQGWSGPTWWCGLGSVTTASALDAAVASALSASNALRGLQRLDGSLVVMDNLEQLDDEARTVLARWAAACPRVRFLGTSRSRLGVPSERCVDLEPLSAEAAEALFLERARTRRPDYAATTPPDVLRALVDAVDRIPLALELAAARAGVLDPEVLLERLADLATLGDAARRMDDAVAWSFALLEPSAERAVARLSVFAAGFTADGAAAVAGVPDGVALIEQLVDRSLARPVDGGRRVRMYEIVRQHAAARLASTPDAAREAADRHLDWVVREVQAWRGTANPPRDSTHRLLEEHLADTRAAQEHARVTGRADDALALARALTSLLGVSADWAYALDRLHEAATDPRVTDGGDRIRGLVEAASLAAHRRGVEAGAETADRAWALASALGTPELLGRAEHCRGVIAVRRARWTEAAARFREALAQLDRCAESAVAGQRAVVYADLAQVLSRSGDPASARPLLQRSLALRRTVGDRRGEAHDLLSLGLVHLALDELLDAEQATRASLVIVGESGDEVHHAKALANLGAIALTGGRPLEAARLSRQAADRFAALDHRLSIASALGNLTNALGQLGRVDEGLRAGEEAVSHALAVGADHLAACNRVHLAEVLHEAGRRGEADRVLAESLRTFDRAGEARLHGWALRVRALVHADPCPTDAWFTTLAQSRTGQDGWIAEAAAAAARRSPPPRSLPSTAVGTAWGQLVALAGGNRSAAAGLARPDPARDDLSPLESMGDLRRLKADLRIE